MCVEKLWNEICGRGKLEKPREKRTQTPFRPPRNHIERLRHEVGTSAVGGQRLTLAQWNGLKGIGRSF